MIKKLLCIIMTAIFIIGMTSTSFAANIDATIIGNTEEKVYSSATLEDDFADNRVIVIMTNAASLTGEEYGILDFPEVSCSSVSDLMPSVTAKANAKANNVEIASLYAAPDGAVVTSDFYDINTQEFRKILCLTLAAPGKENVLEAIRALEARSDVYYVGPDYAVTTCAVTANETYLGNQWAVSKLKISQAWDVVAKTNTVYVGIVDTGIDTSHPDLNGIVTTSKFRTFTTTSAATDLDGHGTSMAGVVGLVTDEMYDLSDNTWNIRLVSLKAQNYSDGYSSGMISAINAADDLGIPILNISLGTATITTTTSYMLLGQAIVNYSGLVVCGSGNNGLDLDDAGNGFYPAKFTEYDNLITVGASTSGDQVASFSNYGATTVDIFAPGTGILSCYPLDMCDYTYHTDLHYDYGYHYVDGTSIATPFVAGVAALMLAENPALTAADIKEGIISTADQLDAFDRKCVSDGRLNAYAAIMYVHTHSFYYTSTATTHTGNCSCGATTGTVAHMWVTDLDGASVCRTCGYYRASQIESYPNTVS